MTEDAAIPHPGIRRIRTLILTPTRELAIQIGDSFAAYGRHTQLKHLVIFGGVPQQSQVSALQRGVDILVATPGRLLDLCDQRYVDLKNVQYFVLDEADRMLDMGFVHDVKKIIARIPQKRQTLFFSATMPPEIQKLAGSILSHPEKVEVTPVSSTAETIQQSIYFVEKQDKKDLLLHILKDVDIPTALVFTRTKHGADKVAKGLSQAGIRAEAIHGNKSQNARQRALLNFKSRQTRILVATDIAARGIDIDELTHVINFELPNVPETYVHRIGRTGRAGANGTAYSFCDTEEREFLRDIQKLIGLSIPVVGDHPFPSQGASAVRSAAPGGQSGRQNQGRQQQQQKDRRNGRGNQRPVERRNPEQPLQKRPANQPGQAPVRERGIGQQLPIQKKPVSQQPVQSVATEQPIEQQQAKRPEPQQAKRPEQQQSKRPVQQPSKAIQEQPIKKPAAPPALNEDNQGFISKHAVNQASGDEKW